MYEGMGKAIGNAIKLLVFVAIAQIPFTLIGVWVVCAKLFEFCDAHWKW